MICQTSAVKNLKFASVNAMVLSIEHISRVLVQWKLEKTSQNLSTVVFFVDRGESPEDWQQLNAEGVPANGLYEYVDYTANLLDINKIYYYRVRAAELAPDGLVVQQFTSPTFTWDSNLDLAGLYIVEEHLFAHRYVHGVPAMVFKKRRDGTYCPNCWDVILKRSTKSNCLTCFGTGKIGGFYPPIEVWASFDPDNRIEQVAQWGRRQVGQIDIQFTNYPLLNPDDILLELQPNKFWKVEYVRAPEKNRAVMLQMVRLNTVNPSDIEYKLDVPEDRRRALVTELNTRIAEGDF